MEMVVVVVVAPAVVITMTKDQDLFSWLVFYSFLYCNKCARTHTLTESRRGSCLNLSTNKYFFCLSSLSFI
jgi:hypothetical protein